MIDCKNISGKFLFLIARVVYNYVFKTVDTIIFTTNFILFAINMKLSKLYYSFRSFYHFNHFLIVLTSRFKVFIIDFFVANHAKLAINLSCQLRSQLD